MYIQGYLVPVQTDNKDKYIHVAQWVGEVMMQHGAIEIMEAWGDGLKPGKVTDFLQAVKAEENENVVFSWVIWPSKDVATKAHEEMMKDERFSEDMDMPFDGMRMVMGDFEPLVTFGRD